jgi:predicted nucleotidyltransferase
LDILRANEAGLRAAGIGRLAIFGSTARGEAGPHSDVDILVRLTSRERGFAFVGQLDAVRETLEGLLHHCVDLIAEPVRGERFEKALERDCVVAFD